MSRSLAKQSLILVGITLGVALGAQAHDGKPESKEVCAGFVVLSSGYAVLSAMPAGPDHSMHATPSAPAAAGAQTSGHHAAASHGHAMAHKDHGQQAMGQPASRTMPAEKAPAEPLLGFQHGQDIVPQAGMTCVPVGDVENNAWMTVSPESNLVVLAKSLKGALAHNSRANESLALEIVLDGKSVEQAQVRLLARMPHHDRRLPGGHGPANDPDVQGLEAKYDTAQGRYVVPTVDFSMSGPWLFEVQIQQENTMHKAYFATEIGEE